MRQHTKNLPTNILNLKKSFVHLHSPLFLKRNKTEFFKDFFFEQKQGLSSNFAPLLSEFE